MIDLHSHLLPGIDDGSPSVERSVSVLTRMAADGITDVVLTPHLTYSEWIRYGQDALEQRQEVFEVLRARTPAVPRLQLGFEVMLDEAIRTEPFGDRRFALAGSRFFLVEFPVFVAPRSAVHVLDRIREAGGVPLVAHPERYLQCTPDSVAHWREAGARIQLDATALTRRSRQGRMARRMLAAGLADVVAADNHGDRRTLLGARSYLADRGFEAVARQLTTENPRRMLEDAMPEPVPPIRVRGPIVAPVPRWLRGRKGS